MLNFPFETADLILHEAGVPPIHTPISVLSSLPEEIKRKIMLYHVRYLLVKGVWFYERLPLPRHEIGLALFQGGDIIVVRVACGRVAKKPSVGVSPRLIYCSACLKEGKEGFGLDCDPSCAAAMMSRPSLACPRPSLGSTTQSTSLSRSPPSPMYAHASPQPSPLLRNCTCLSIPCCLVTF